MMRKMLIVTALTLFVLANLQPASFAAQQKTAAKTAQTAPAASAKPTAKPNFSMIAGTVTGINAADPNNIEFQIKSDADGSVRTVSVTPWTNVTKVTDPSEIKSGETIRVMTRKMNDKEVAMGIMFGKIKNIPPMPPAKKPLTPVVTDTKVKK